MDKLMHENDTMQDEEIYALLDTALDTERLTVSEELIQKTLRRAAEENEPKVVSFKKTAKKRRASFMKYASAAAAAVFVLVVGGGALLRRMPMSSKSEDLSIAGEDAMRSSENAAHFDSKGEVNHNQHVQALGDADEKTDRADELYSAAPGSAEDAVCWNGAVVTLKEETRAVLADCWKDVPAQAECWEFVRRDGSWEDELVQYLRADGLQAETLSAKGGYVYMVACADGSKKTIGTDAPLDLIVRIETGDGSLWGLFGQTVRLYME